MTAEMKRKRFDMIQEAYDILKNPRRRTAYNRYQTTSWDQQGIIREMEDNGVKRILKLIEEPMLIEQDIILKMMNNFGWLVPGKIIIK